MSVFFIFGYFRTYICSVHGLLYCLCEVVFLVHMSSGRIFDSTLGPIIRRPGMTVHIW